MDSKDIQENRQNLKNMFFRKEDQKTIETIPTLQKMKDTQEALAKVSAFGIPPS